MQDKSLTISTSNEMPMGKAERKRVSRMRAKMAKAVDMILKKANECLELARTESDSAITQHENAERMRTAADRQNAGARKLALLGYALEADAIDLQTLTETQT
jgi:hypothetical protein